MELVYDLLVVLHLLGMAAIVGSYLVALRTPRVLPGMLHGALTALVTGVILVGLRETDVVTGHGEVDQAKIAVKLVVALVVTALAWVYRKRQDAAPAGVVHAIGGLAVLNVVVAVLWS